MTESPETPPVSYISRVVCGPILFTVDSMCRIVFGSEERTKDPGETVLSRVKRLTWSVVVPSDTDTIHLFPLKPHWRVTLTGQI